MRSVVAGDPASSLEGSPITAASGLEEMCELSAITGWSLSDDFLLDSDSGPRSRAKVKIAIPHATSTHIESSSLFAPFPIFPTFTTQEIEGMILRRRTEAASPVNTVHTPLIASTSKIDDAEVPPTTNAMNPREKRKLAKSAKKVGKFLGEAAVVIDADENPAVRDPQEKRTFLKSVSKLSKSFSEAIFSEDDQSTRGLLITKDPVSNRKHGHKSSTSYSTTTLSYLPAAYPVSFHGSGAFGMGAFEVPVLPKRSGETISSPPVLKVDTKKRALRVRSSSLSLFSTSSVATTSTNTYNSNEETYASPAIVESRIRRAKAERLSRRLGVIVPSEILLSTALAKLSQSEPDTSTCTVLNGSFKRQRNFSLQADKTMSGTSAALQPLKRSNSERRSKSLNCEEPEALLERQRVMNVRRAVKMTHVFGSKLPDGLLQVSDNPKTCILGEDLELTDEDRQRLEYLWSNDRNTFYDLLGIEKQDIPPPHRRARSASYVSSIAPSVAYNDWDNVSIADACDTLPITIHHEHGLTRSAAITGPKPKPLKFEPPPPTTPPPFSAYTQFPSELLTPPQSPSTSESNHGLAIQPVRPSYPPSSNSTAKFRAKRERAAKLSKFFGVGYQDLFNTMMHGYTITVERSIGQVEHETNIRMDKGKSAKVKETTERRGDMKEVIDRLRELKA